MLAGYIRDQGAHRGRHAYHKAHADRLARKLEEPGASLLERAARLRACCELLLYRPDGTFLGADMRCGQRLCPMCQARRATTWGHRLRDVADQLGAIPGVWVLLTLTMRNVRLSETRRAIRQLHRAVDRLAKRREWAARGWIRQTEVTVNVSSSSAHPHCHLLLLLPVDYYRTPARVIPSRRKDGRGRPRIEPGYMAQARIRELWAEALGVEYDPRVDIRPVKMSDPAARSAVILEVAKYGVKPAELVGLEPADLVTLISELGAHRTFSVCGELRSYIPPRNLERRRQLEKMIRLGKLPGPQEPALEWSDIAKWNPATRRFDLLEAPPAGVTGRPYWVYRPPPPLPLQDHSPLVPPEWIGDVWSEPENFAPDDREERRRLAELQSRRPDLYRNKRRE